MCKSVVHMEEDAHTYKYDSVFARRAWQAARELFILLAIIFIFWANWRFPQANFDIDFPMQYVFDID